MNQAAKEPEIKGRLFPRYQVPLKANFGDITCVIRDWSTNGLGCFEISGELTPSKTYDVIIEIDSNVQNIKFDLRVEVVWTDPQNKRAGCRILEESENTKHLQDLADLYLDNKVEFDDTKLVILDKSKSNNNSGANANMTGSGFFLQRIFGILVFSLIGLAALYFLSTIVYERFYIKDAYSASIAADVTPVIAERDGIIKYSGDQVEVTPNMELGVIQAANTSLDNEENLKVMSPCFCYTILRSRQDGEFVRGGDMLMLLSQKDSKPNISVKVPFRYLGDIGDKAKINLTYLDGTYVQNVKIVSVPTITVENATQVEIIVEAGRQLSAADHGQPVWAVLDTSPWGDWVTSLFR